MPSDDDIYRFTRDNRRLIADLLDTLDDGQWNAPTLCDGWTVGHVAAHLLQPMLVGFGRFFLTALRYGGDTDRTIDHLTRRLRAMPRQTTTDLLRRHASDRVNPPRVGPMGPFAETCVHLRDITRPLGQDVDVPTTHWHLLLDYLAGPRPARALIQPGRADNLRLAATDIDWTHGFGLSVTGPAEALAMVLTGRSAALADLAGPGTDILRQRLETGRTTAS
ncbi:Mycothiol-dependent maleylpyruvate isomerase metal-binding domain-containing protein [Frankia sp. AiPs1]|uniref:maleylpyruvate isomerase family mycothiol-dependent enzyme n=1 Tax=Frankia sp. AiPa1 TaxID=573492 RepID=UPI00202AD53C|nr:maleylpyruvate isomerase family mycothiol-dependent enzyme [Frankia sp. AiPa1]MCL9763032.1 maleylpyruvate isomerase family mycothiol-dependent enzyme [Frankia sp. AiPa1]